MKTLRSVSGAALLLLASCAGDGGSSSAPVAKESMEQRFNKSGKDGYQQTSEGAWVASNEKRSSFETNRESAYFKGDFNGKQYKTKDFSKKSWWGGGKEVDRKSFSGDTDGTRFQKNSRFGGQAAKESGSASGMTGSYATTGYDTSTANEASGRRLSKPSDAETDVRRRVFGQPESVDWREQRPLSVDQTKSILGR